MSSSRREFESYIIKLEVVQGNSSESKYYLPLRPRLHASTPNDYISPSSEKIGRSRTRKPMMSITSIQHSFLVLLEIQHHEPCQFSCMPKCAVYILVLVLLQIVIHHWTIRGCGVMQRTIKYMQDRKSTRLNSSHITIS